MEAIYQFFIDLLTLHYEEPLQLVLKILYLVLIGFLVFWLIFLALSKLTFKRSSAANDFHRDDSLTLTYLWSIIGSLALINLFWFGILYVNGMDKLQPGESVFWLSLTPTLLLFISFVGLFLVRYFSFRKTLA